MGRGALLCLPLGILLCRWFLPLAGELSVFVAERSPEGWIIQTAQKTDISSGMETNAVGGRDYSGRRLSKPVAVASSRTLGLVWL